MSDKLLGWTLVLLCLTGVHCSRWRVEYQQQSIRAVKGSNVTFLCSVYNPDMQEISVLWGRVKSRWIRFLPFGWSKKVFREFEYIGDKLDDCSLRIREVGCHHAGKYVVFFNKTSRFPGGIGPTLKVVDLTISVTESSGNGVIKEGDSVRLTCGNACDDSNASSAFTWFKNGESMYEGPSFSLENVTLTDSGNYTCSLNPVSRTTSGAIHIDVEYGPKNTSVSIGPQAAADVGIVLALACSSHANPPVKNYTWFKTDGNRSFGVGHQRVFFPAEAGKFFCSVTNKHGSQNSSVFLVNTIKDHQEKISKEVFIVSTVAAFLIVTVFVAVIRWCQRGEKEAEAECSQDEQNGDYENWLTIEPIQPHSRHPFGEVTQQVDYTAVYFHSKRQRNTEERQSSQHEAVVYSTVCSEL